jgi:PadR family transcriptional regulator, regulatory protein PadR
MTDDRLELPQGTLDLLILKALSLEPQHGWAISERLRQVSRAALQIPQGSLYPALHRLEKQRWISATWKMSANKQRTRVYRLTAAGRRQLVSERSRWQAMVDAMAGILSKPQTSQS